MSRTSRRQFDTRWFVLALLVSMAIFNVVTVSLPLDVNEWTASLHNFIETLGPGDNVLVCTNLGAGQLAECYDSCVIVLKHLASRGVNLVEISTGGPWGGGMTNIPIGLNTVPAMSWASPDCTPD